MKREHGSMLGLYTIGIAALFLAGFFLLVIFGAYGYRNIVSGQNANMRGRAILSYLSTTVRGYDRRGGVQLSDSEYGTVLSIADGSGYVMRVYRYEGELVEEYVAEGSDFTPDSAQHIGATDVFKVRDEGGLLIFETDAGRVLVDLRTAGGDVQ